MASAWGKSFGVAWGNSWGFVTESSVKRGGISAHHRKIMKDDEELLLCISHFMCIASNN
jgi:hypothetical protein